MTREEMRVAQTSAIRLDRVGAVAVLASLVSWLCLGPMGAQTLQQPAGDRSLPSETPETFEAVIE